MDIVTISDLRAVWAEMARIFNSNPFLAFEFIENPEATIEHMGYRLMEPARTALMQSLPV